MVRVAKARLILPNKGSRTGVVYIPADIIKDSSFPFRANEQVVVRIDEDKIILEKEVVAQ